MSLVIINSPEKIKQKGRYNYTIMRSFFKDTNFDFDKFKIKSNDKQLIIDWFYDSGLKQFIDVANTLSTWKPYIINSFILIEDALTKPNKKEEKPVPRRLSNGPIEGINAILAIININGKGYTNFYRYKNRCIYVVNK